MFIWTFKIALPMSFYGLPKVNFALVSTQVIKILFSIHIIAERLSARQVILTRIAACVCIYVVCIYVCIYVSPSYLGRRNIYLSCRVICAKPDLLHVNEFPYGTPLRSLRI